MKTVIVHGVEHKGSTYNVVQLIKNELGICNDDLKEFFLPKDLPRFCIGCKNCFMKGEEFCPHQDYVTPIKEAIYNAELIILASPVYALYATAQMKAFLDHFAFQFIGHRPNKSMFSKTALVVSTGAILGTKSAIKNMSQNLNYWGISHIFSFGFVTSVINWEEISKKNILKIEHKVKKISCKIKNNNSKPNLKMKLLFNMIRRFYNKSKISGESWKPIPYEMEYWEKLGWLNKKRPWKNKQ